LARDAKTNNVDRTKGGFVGGSKKNPGGRGKLGKKEMSYKKNGVQVDTVRKKRGAGKRPSTLGKPKKLKNGQAVPNSLAHKGQRTEGGL